MAAGESYVNGMACHPVASSAEILRRSYDSGADAALCRAPSYAYASAPAMVLRRCKTPGALGPSVYIEPMQGLEGYLSVAFERKHVGLAPVVSDAHATYVLHLYWGSDDASGKNGKHSDGTPTLQLIERSSGTVSVCLSPQSREHLARREGYRRNLRRPGEGVGREEVSAAELT